VPELRPRVAARAAQKPRATAEARCLRPARARFLPQPGAFSEGEKGRLRTSAPRSSVERPRKLGACARARFLFHRTCTFQRAPRFAVEFEARRPEAIFRPVTWHFLAAAPARFFERQIFTEPTEISVY